MSIERRNIVYIYKIIDNRIYDKPGGGMDAEFIADVATVCRDSMDRNAEIKCYFLIRLSLSHLSHNIFLTVAQMFKCNISGVFFIA